MNGEELTERSRQLAEKYCSFGLTRGQASHIVLAGGADVAGRIVERMIEWSLDVVTATTQVLAEQRWNEGETA